MGAGNDWRFVIARPGDDPFANLAQAMVTAVDGPGLLAPPATQQDSPVADPDPYQLAMVEYALRGSRAGLADALAQCEIPATTAVLVLIDQFEELFRFRDLVRCDEGGDTYDVRNDAMAFANLLLENLKHTDRQIFIVITMRSDFLGHCDAFPGLPEAISDSQFLTPRMTRPQLSEAIHGPLESCGYGVESGLVNRILNDVGSDPDQLPLMQHALLRAWEQAQVNAARTGKNAHEDFSSLTTTGKNAHSTTLMIADYEYVGGVSGALNHHADEIFNVLGDKASGTSLQCVAERLFCSLSEQRDGGPLTRRPIRVAEAAQEAGATEIDIESVARAFQAANLLVFSPPGQPLGPETRLDISHESLLRQWQRLAAWIDTESKSALSYRRLMDAVRSGDSILSDTQLAQAQEWFRISQPNVHWAMRYDRATLQAESLFDRCVQLIVASDQARVAWKAREQTCFRR